MRGKYKIGLKFPYTPGWEGSGTVVEVGPGLLGKMFLNKRVAFSKVWELGSFKVGGAFADFCLTEVKCVVPLTDDISLE
jgi:NADPH:quinone reductase-like Zn-dependent oxidoreductase